MIEEKSSFRASKMMIWVVETKDNDDEDKKEIVHGCRSTVEQMSKPPT